MLINIAECEHLIRRMLVLDPKKRFTISQIRQHKWLTSGAAQSSMKEEPCGAAAPSTSTVTCAGEFDEQILRLMNTLGIEQSKTVEALKSDSYNHYTAIYYLLLEKRKQHRGIVSSSCVRSEAQHRRPSSIADQAMMNSSAGPRPVLASTKQGPFSQTTDCVSLQGAAASSTQQQTAFSDIENASLRDVLPSGKIPCAAVRQTSTGPGRGVITSSIDEGVELDSDLCSTTSICSNFSHDSQVECVSLQGSVLSSKNIFSLDGGGSGGAGSIPQNDALTGMCQLNTSNQSISTGIGSPFMSFDSNVEAELMSSLSSCVQTSGLISASPPLPCANQTMTATTMTPPFSSKFSHAGTNAARDNARSCLRESRSPVSFREGRRASDEVLAHGVVAFRQRLRDTMKTRGVAELRKEMELLQNKYRPNLTEEELLQLQLEHVQYQEVCRRRQWSLDETQPAKDNNLSGRSLSSSGRSHKENQIFSLVHADPASPSLSCAMVRGAGTLVEPLVAVKQSGYPLRTTEFANKLSLHQNIIQNRLQQIFLKRTISPAATSELLPGFHQQFQQLHIEPSSQGNASLSVSQKPQTLAPHYALMSAGAITSGCILPTFNFLGTSVSQLEASSLADSASSPVSNDATINSGAILGQKAENSAEFGAYKCIGVAMHHSHVPPRLMRRHFVRQSSYKLSQQAAHSVTTTDEDLELNNLLQWQPGCDLLPQLSPTFEETNEEDDGESKEVSGKSPSSMDLA